MLYLTLLLLTGISWTSPESTQSPHLQQAGIPAVDAGATAEFEQMGLEIGGEATGDESGLSVSLSSDGRVVAIGAVYNQGAGREAGHVRVYAWDGSAWIQRGDDIDGEAADDRSGYAVSLSSDGIVVAIGAPGNDGAGSFAGHVRVFEWTGAEWAQRGNDIDGEAASDASGWSVSLSSDGAVVAIGALYNKDAGSVAGQVRVYDWSGTAWIQRGGDLDGRAAGDWSGSSVSLSSDGRVVAIGAPGDGHGSHAGRVRVYAWSGEAWFQRGSDIPGEAVRDWFGHAVSLSSDGSLAAIGAPGNDGAGSEAGHVRIYAWNGLAWVQQGDDVDGEAATARSGSSVSISSNGKFVAIGGIGSDGPGSDSGRVRIYAWNGQTWVKQGSDIRGEAAVDHAGYALSLSADGHLVAIGAPLNDGAGSNAGHVRIYELRSGRMDGSETRDAATPGSKD